MDSFPDELLLEIFSRLEDGVTLLDCVSLVCRRWCALSRDPRAWRSVRVEFETDTWIRRVDRPADRVQRERVAMDEARVVLHAPALGHFSWSWNCSGPHINRPQAMALSAVRRSRATVGDVYLGDVSFMAEPAWAVICGVLWRSRNHITALHMEMPDEYEEDEELEEEEELEVEEEVVEEEEEEEVVVDEDCAPTRQTDTVAAEVDGLEDEQCDVVAAWAEADGYCRSPLEVLVQLRRLERLSLECTRWIPYAGELRVEGELLPALRYLDLHYSDHHGLMLDLVRGTAARLRHLHLPDEFHFLFAQRGRTAPSLPPALLSSVSRCVQLRSLACNLMHLACAFTMPHLSRLELWLSHQEVLPQDVAERVRLLAQHGESLAGLRQLKLVCRGSLTEVKQRHAVRESVATLLLAVARAAQNVTDADIWGVALEDVVDELLGSLPRLETVRLYWSGSQDHVGALAALPNLRRVEGWSISKDSLPAAAIVARLQSARPDFQLNIR